MSLSGHTELGRAIDEWSVCEAWVNSIFSYLLHVEIDIGHAIMASFTAGTKRDMLERVAELTKMPDDVRSELKDICKEFSRLTTQRNKIVHGEWVLMADGTQYRVGNTKYLRYFDRYNATGADPQNAIFTIEQITQFANDCDKLKMQFAALADSEAFRNRFWSGTKEDI